MGLTGSDSASILVEAHSAIGNSISVAGGEVNYLPWARQEPEYETRICLPLLFSKAIHGSVSTDKQ